MNKTAKSIVVSILFLICLFGFSIPVNAAPCGPNEPSCDTVQNCTDGNGFTHSVLCKYQPPPPVGCNFTDAVTSVTSGDYIRYTIKFSSGTLTQYYTTGACGIATGGSGDPSTPYCFAGMGQTPQCGGHTTAIGTGTCVVNAVLSDGNSCSLNVTVNPLLQPDLRVTAFSVPNGTPGSTVMTSVTVANVGNWQTGGSFKVAIHRNRSTMDCSTTEHASVITSALAASQSRVINNIPLTLPGTVGSYTAVSMADADCQYRESNESNNTRTRNYNVTGSCVQTNPIAPVLDLPANGELVSSQNPNLSWLPFSATDWGQGCPNTNSFYVNLSGDGVNVANAPISGNLNSYTAPTLTCGYDYVWSVSASNTVGGVKVNSGNRGFRYNCPPTPTPTPTPVVSFFQAFGGGVTALENIDDSDLPSPGFVSMNNSYAPRPDAAGIVKFAGFTPQTPFNRYSQRGTPPGWNLPAYHDDGVLEKLSYKALVDTALKNAGTSSLSPSLCTQAAPNPKYHIWCFSGPAFFEQVLTNALANSNPTEIYNIVIPSPGTAPLSVAITSPKDIASTTQSVIIFVDGDLTIGDSTTDAKITSNQSNSGFAALVSGNLTVGGAVTRLQGLYVFPGQFKDGINVTNFLSTDGMIIGTGTDAFSLGSLTRAPNAPNVAGEYFIYSGKYLYLFRNVLARPKTKWSELAPN